MNRIEELQQQLHAAVAAPEKLKIMEQLCLACYRTHHHLCCSTATAALSLAQSMGDKYWIARSLHLLGGGLTTAGDYSSALIHLERAAALFRELNNPMMQARVLRSIGSAHFRRGDAVRAIAPLLGALTVFEREECNIEIMYTLNTLGSSYSMLARHTEALRALSRAVEISRRENFRDNLPGLCSNIAHIYMRTEDPESASAYALQAVEYAKASGDTLTHISVMTTLGNVYLLQNRLDDALHCYMSIYDMVVALKMPVRAAGLMLNLGKVNRQKDELKAALQYYRQAAECLGESDGNDILGEILFNMGDAYYAIENYNDALSCVNRAMNIAEQLHRFDVQAQAARLRSRIYEKTGDTEKALSNYKLYMEKSTAFLDIQKHRDLLLEEKRIEIENIEHRLKEYREKVMEVSEKVAEKNEAITEMALKLAQHSELLSKTETLLKKSFRVEREDAGQLISFLQSSVRNTSDWGGFSKQFVRYYGSFYERLARTYPLLTPSELKICSLIKIGLSSKEIGDLLYISPKTVDLHRSNIRKKMGLSRKKSLAGCIAAL